MLEESCLVITITSMVMASTITLEINIMVIIIFGTGIVGILMHKHLTIQN
jgi:hypothetical protein